MTTPTSSLSRLLLGVALAGAGSFALFAGGAKAATPNPCTFGGITPTCDDDGGQITVTDKIFTFLTLPTLGPGDIEIQYDPGALLPGAALPGVHTIDVDFTPDIVGPIGGISGFFEYKVAITSSKAFDVIGLDWAGFNSPSGNLNVTKEVFQDNFITPAVLTLSTDGSTGDISGLNLTEIWVRDTYTVPQGAILDNFGDAYSQTVPGPLPLLGAGTAFGFSRRMRRRIKQRHSMG